MRDYHALDQIERAAMEIIHEAVLPHYHRQRARAMRADAGRQFSR